MRVGGSDELPTVHRRPGGSFITEETTGEKKNQLQQVAQEAAGGSNIARKRFFTPHNSCQRAWSINRGREFLLPSSPHFANSKPLRAAYEVCSNRTHLHKTVD